MMNLINSLIKRLSLDNIVTDSGSSHNIHYTLNTRVDFGITGNAIIDYIKLNNHKIYNEAIAVETLDIGYVRAMFPTSKIIRISYDYDDIVQIALNRFFKLYVADYWRNPGKSSWEQLLKNYHEYSNLEIIPAPSSLTVNQKSLIISDMISYMESTYVDFSGDHDDNILDFKFKNFKLFNHESIDSLTKFIKAEHNDAVVECFKHYINLQPHNTLSSLNYGPAVCYITFLPASNGNFIKSAIHYMRSPDSDTICVSETGHMHGPTTSDTNTGASLIDSDNITNDQLEFLDNIIIEWSMYKSLNFPIVIPLHINDVTAINEKQFPGVGNYKIIYIYNTEETILQRAINWFSKVYIGLNESIGQRLFEQVYKEAQATADPEHLLCDDHPHPLDLTKKQAAVVFNLILRNTIDTNKHFQKLDSVPSNTIQISLYDLQTNPIPSLERIASFLNLPMNDKVRDLADEYMLQQLSLSQLMSYFK